ncbi:hypothetical protein SAMN05421812_11772 [Asanoa hainanensis]|uniref:2'-5' RNA ligase superfamily protein n=1 Tax=Asanoa hainanensis TaxID=560556 RepID=A0A239PBM7_9ACTN|nr:hypothetical protein [Asanoa hainanensis]SNT64517.1 hypothetical protein SAMN05421812_11772 [Asanoa hainanensis]
MSDRYQELWQQGRRAVLRGEVTVQPFGTGCWPLSVALRLDVATRGRFADLAAEAAAFVGDAYLFDHHVTVRAVDDGPPAVYESALAEATAGLGPVRLRFAGVVVTTTNVLACGYPVDETAPRLRSRLAEALAASGADGLERDLRRDIWHTTLVGFTGPVADPRGLVEWATARLNQPFGTARCDFADLNRWTATGRQQHANPIVSARLAG